MCNETAKRSLIAPSWAQAVTRYERMVGLRQYRQKVGRERRWGGGITEAGKQELDPKAVQGFLKGSQHLQGSSLGREAQPGTRVGVDQG